jgi:hypothetical protein
MRSFVLAALAAAALLQARDAGAAPPPPRGPHPRIALTAPVLAALKRQASASQGPVAAAIQACRKNTTAAGSPSGYQGDAWAFPASACALAYQLTGDKSYAAKGTRLLRALLEDVEQVGDRRACVPGAPPEQAIAAVKRDTGYAIRFIGPHAALTYDWLHGAPGMDEGLRAQARGCFAAWVDWYTRRGYLRTMPGANYHAGYVVAKALIAVATAGEGDGAGDRHFRDVVDDVFGRQIIGNGLAADAGGRPRGARHGVLVGGDWIEGWQYGPLSVVEYAFAARVLGEHGMDVKPVARWADDLTLRFLHGLTPTRDRMWIGGDTQNEGPFLDADGAALLATLLGPGTATGAGWAAALRASLNLRTWGPPVFDAVAAGRAVAPIDPLAGGRPTSFLAAGTRNLYTRSGWDRGAFWAVFTSPPRLVDDHQRVDASNFVFVRGADALVVDPSPYGSRSSLTGNALTVDSAVVLDRYKPSQTPWSEAELHWARATASGAATARADITRAFNFSGTESDLPLAWRDWLFLPEGEIVVVDRARTGGPSRAGYIRFRTPATLSRTKDGARGTIGGSALVIHAVVQEPAPAVTVNRVAAGDCPEPNFGACGAARFAVGEYAVKLTGDALLAIHVLDGVGRNEPAAEVTPLAGPGLAGASILRAGRRTFVVASREAAASPAPSLSYEAAGDSAARHVVLDAPDDGRGRTAVAAAAVGGRCRITLGAAPGTSVAGHPAMFNVGPAAGGCRVTEDAAIAMDRAR